MSISSAEPETAESLTPEQQRLRQRVRSLQLQDSSPSGGGMSSGRLIAVGLIAAIVLGGAWMIYRGIDRGMKKLAANQSSAAPKQKSDAGDEAGSTEEELSVNEQPEPAPPAKTAPKQVTPPSGKPTTTETTPRVAAVKAGSPVLESKGYILPVHRILISPKIAGMLIKVNIEEGMRVTKGDVLAVLEKTEYEADVARAEAAVAQAHHRWEELQAARPEEIAGAQAEVEEAKAKLVEYESAWKRIQELYQKKVATREQYDTEQSNVETQRKRIARLEQTYQMWARGPRQELRDSAMAQKKQAEADLVKAKWRLANCEVVAPSNGTILRKNAEEGNVVNPLAQQGSYSLCDLADLSDIEVELDVQERDVSKVFDGQRCSINTIAYPKRPYEGYVSRQMPIADRGKGSVSVRVKVIVPPGEEGIYLKPDMSAIVRFYGDISPAAPPDVAEGSKRTEVSQKQRPSRDKVSDDSTVELNIPFANRLPPGVKSKK